jgi:hypothetical protein
MTKIINRTILIGFCLFSGTAIADPAAEAGLLLGKYVGSALFIEKIATKCAAFSKNKITFERAYADALKRLPKQYAREISSQAFKEELLNIDSYYESHSAKLLADAGKYLNEDTKCGLVMGVALSQYQESRIKFANAFPVAP